MNCRFVIARLSAYIDGELPGCDMLAFRSHLSRCEECRREENELRALKRLMGAMPVPLPPEGLEERLLGAVRSRKPKLQLWPRLRLAPLAAACVAIATFGAVTMLRPKDDPEPKAASQPSQGFDLTRDQAYASGYDSLTLGPVALPAGYAKR